MDKYDVMLYPRAFRDIDDIYAYIALEQFPEAHQDRLVGRYAGKGYKQLIVDNYIAIFKIDRATRRVYVITVQYQGRNI